MMIARLALRLGTYWKSLLQDYGAAVKDIVKDSRSRPGKAALMLAGSGALCVLVATKPDPDSFLDALGSSANDLLLLSDRTRNPESEAHVRHLEACCCHGALRSWDLLLATVVWESDHGEGCDLYAARCTYLQPRPLFERHRLVDVGLLGTWLNLRRKMQDCDVNHTQWQ
ncbi:mitochondrial import inner membrane translocase subunit Tim29 isoform X1 [Dermacentor albipictus]|uniref:mitochondrial import inner membrane translocase subunit Tim29 isoform X1 n=1 Tax=Dermacentor albipictus TaxID=60249 RepID=UPI0031FD9AB8